MLGGGSDASDATALTELHALYQWTFRAYKLRGAFEEMTGGIGNATS